MFIEDTLLGRDEFINHAKQIAKRQVVIKDRASSLTGYIPGISSCFDSIKGAYDLYSKDRGENIRTVPAAEWLVDNYYVLMNYINEVNLFFSKNKLKNLPLVNTEFRDNVLYISALPRIYTIAMEIVSHTDGVVDEEKIFDFINAYQDVKYLLIDEVWYIGIMIRIALIEKICDIASKLIYIHNERSLASQFADSIIKIKDKDDEDIEKFLTKCFSKVKSDRQTLIEHFMQRIKGYKSLNSVCRKFFDHKLSHIESNLEKLIRLEHETQTTLQVSIGNAISSLRYLDSVDFNALFERLCRVEQILSEDPIDCYSNMDDSSKEYYRRRVIQLAKETDNTELNVAKTAIKLATKRYEEVPKDERGSHVGYYLAGAGVNELLHALTNKTHDKRRYSRPYVAIRPYIAAILSITAVILFFIAIYANFDESGWLALLILFLSIIPVLTVAYEIVSKSFAKVTLPTTLPRLTFKDGIPEDCATMVIIPTLLSSVKSVVELFDHLEVIYKGNAEKNLYFAVVGDLKDAENSDYPQDRQIAAKGLEMAAKLNAKYLEGYSPQSQDRKSNMVNLSGFRNTDVPIFYFFLRKRVYNEKENRWLGWERKRGAIIEFNNLILRRAETTFNVKSTPEEFLPKIKYVITLDSDTKLNPEDAKKLIGTAAHPLNKPVINYDKGIVEEGYGIFQPRVSVDLESSNQSLFSKIYAGQSGIEPYAIKVSDIYMDLCKEGIFTGKGIYDPNVFNELLEHTIPENQVLSHDLLEGSYIRCGFINNVELMDNFPSKFNSYAMRMHRWVRGDWQISGWLFNKVRNRKGEKIHNPLNVLSKWKIFDNLRRSMVDLSLYLLIMAIALFKTNGKFTWILLPIFVNFVPVIAQFIDSISNRRKNKRHRTFSLVFSGNYQVLLQRILNLAFMPYMAKLMLNAITVTLYRLTVSKSKMLEWVTAADMDKALKGDKTSYYNSMKICILSGVILIITGALSGYKGDIAYSLLSIILGGLWIAAPNIAYNVSKPYVDKKKVDKNEVNESDLRILSRKIWAFYEDYTSTNDNYLPPDNVQFDPVYAIAHRTSPTNIGFYLLSCVGAYDLGYMTKRCMYERIANTFNTLKKLEKWKGHLFNWYDTMSLKVLRPMYVSTVDSGNLAGYMMVTSVALREISKTRPDIDSYMNGIKDILLILGGVNPFSAPQNKGGKSLNPLCEKYINEINSGAYKEDFEKYLEELLNIFKEDEPKSTFTVDAEKSRWYYKLLEFIEEIIKELGESRTEIESLSRKMRELAGQIDEFVAEMNFEALYDKKRELFTIGYNLDEGRLTNSHYDLLMSEARQTSYLAIARGEVPVKHWFKLGRRIITIDKFIGLASWTGTSFEYLMPDLIIKNYETSLLSEAIKSSVLAQKNYIKAKTKPWGISESGYYSFDLNLNYQYKAFGVPNLGFKRGLGDEKVIAPYASILALPYDPIAVTENLKLLVNEEAYGEYGFFEAIDYSTQRLVSQKRLIVKSYMAHHQGMSFIAILNFLKDNIMKERFHSLSEIRSAEFLLKEKIPLFASTNNDVLSQEPYDDILDTTNIRSKPFERDVGEIRGLIPKTLVLSNGNYFVTLTNSGYGYSKLRNININKWDIEGTGQVGGLYVYVKNLNNQKQWTNTFMPQGERPERYDVNFSGDKATFSRWDDEVETTTFVTVSPEDNAEIRWVRITNQKEEDVELEITSYMELALSTNEDYMSHPAFNNLFIRTEFIKEHDALLASKRSRKTSKEELWVISSMQVELNADDDVTVSELQYDTDSALFPGRGVNVAYEIPDITKPLKGSTGSVLNPSMTMRRRISLKEGATANIFIIVGAAETREEAMKLIDKYNDTRNARRGFDLSYTRSIIEAEYLNITEEQEDAYNDIISHILNLSPIRRNYKDSIEKCSLGKHTLWSFGISGDIPLVTAFIKSKDDEEFVELLINAHRFLKVKGIDADFLFIVNDEAGYMQPIRDMVSKILISNNMISYLNNKGGFFIIPVHALTKDKKNMLINASKIILKSDGPSIKDQLRYTPDVIYNDMSDPFVSVKQEIEIKKDIALKLNENLIYDNGIGGFNETGDEYVIYKPTPAPWINVISNGFFGFHISENGSGYVWNANSSENRLTKWSNNPVADPSNEVIYILDMDKGIYRSLTPKPCGKGKYIVRHGFGYSLFESEYDGIRTRLIVYTTEQDPVKVSFVEIKNTNNKPVNLRFFYYIEPVLGVLPQKTLQFLSTVPGDNMLFVKNTFQDQQRYGTIHDYGYPGIITFMSSSHKISCYTGDRFSFIGINGNVNRPAALVKGELDNRYGGGLMPCLAIATDITIGPDSSEEIVFHFGEAESKEKAYEIVESLSTPELAKDKLVKWKAYWSRTLSTFKFNTPNVSMNLMINGWLLYQTLSCRIMARSAFYQSGGAFGYRDQLQDSMALLYVNPDLTKKQILIHCRHQFVEGDVQHWWHEPEGKGIRTRYSDDLLWLPYVVTEYVNKTGDTEILNITEPYLESPLLSEDEHERYESPTLSEEKGTVYDHCIRAIDHALKFGERGLCLIGGGDWNDGMNMVGYKGKGESVWLSWFMLEILNRFIPICEKYNDTMKAARYKFEFKRLFNSIFESAWDGSWFKRAFFDDGTPLGSSKNSECSIDSISQTWSVISITNALESEIIDYEELAEKFEQIKQAMHSVDIHLVDRDNGIVKLLYPPFDTGETNPGYIKSYVPGVRENGGQYTHAAIWYIIALSRLGYINNNFKESVGQALEVFDMINPVNHGRTSIETSKYKIEPYVVAADVYSVGNNAGRGGWSWYTGSSAWLYRACVEEILGVRIVKGKYIYIRKILPDNWKEFSFEYSHVSSLKNNEKRVTLHKFKVMKSGSEYVEIDGVRVNIDDYKDEFNFILPLYDDGDTHSFICSVDG